jgi:hypothetical protein
MESYKLRAYIRSARPTKKGRSHLQARITEHHTALRVTRTTLIMRIVSLSHSKNKPAQSPAFFLLRRSETRRGFAGFWPPPSSCFLANPLYQTQEATWHYRRLKEGVSLKTARYTRALPAWFAYNFEQLANPRPNFRYTQTKLRKLARTAPQLRVPWNPRAVPSVELF